MFTVTVDGKEYLLHGQEEERKHFIQNTARYLTDCEHKVEVGSCGHFPIKTDKTIWTEEDFSDFLERGDR
jgi:hypothetical protein